MDRRHFLQGFAALSATPAFAEAPARSVRPTFRPSDLASRTLPGAEDLLRSANLSGRTSLVFSDLSSGRIVASSAPLRALPPASVAKVLTALYGLDQLGSEYRFQTRLGYRGSFSNGRIDGDLVLIGGGDPTLTTDGLAQLAAGLKANGVREVSGGLLVWGGHLAQSRDIDGSQPDHVGYNPAISGMNLNFNRVHFEWRAAQSGYDISLQARTEKYRPSVATARMDVVKRASPVYAYEKAANEDRWSVAHGALGRSGSRWLPVRVPEAYTGDVLLTLLRSHGIVVKGYEIVNTAPEIRVLSSVQSATLREICRGMLKFSTNLTAECIGLAASRASSLRKSAQSMSRWAEGAFGARHIDLVDHSGLGDASRVAARDVVRVLASREAQASLRPMLKTFNLRDTKDAAASKMFDVRAKTGTLNFVSGLAGYAERPAASDQTLAFAIFSADLPLRQGLSKLERESPPGGRTWSRRARVLQSKLIRRFASDPSG